MESFLVKSWTYLNQTSKFQISLFPDTSHACSSCLLQCATVMSVEQIIPVSRLRGEWYIPENEEWN